MQSHSTTVIVVKKDNEVAIGSDGQVTLDKTIFKSKAKKIRKLYKNKVLCGFAGSAADGLTLYDKLEAKLEEYNGNLPRAAVELAKLWRTDKILRRLEALLIAADKDNIFILSGNGDVLQPDENIAAIGSGGNYALAAAKVLNKYSNLSAKDIVKESLNIAADICIYTNHNISIETL